MNNHLPSLLWLSTPLADLWPSHRFYHMTGYGPDEVLGHNW